MRGRGGGGVGGSRRQQQQQQQSWLSTLVDSIFSFVRAAEFEILFVVFFLIAFLIFKDLTSRPEYNQILVKKPGGHDGWPFG
ncbi:uncharacterized protein LOC141646699 [Silene latifolia]|uniref:uncharacterized protein LOC141646699 n=1 Tax=Silene latifolia TaxID=37657 RepID=UPI003D786C14